MTCIKNVKLYTGEKSYPDGILLEENGKILYAGSAAACPALSKTPDNVLDGEGGILMPAFYNAHCHAAMTLLRGVGSDLKLMDWLHIIWPMEAKMTPECIYWGTQHAIMEMVRRGTAGFADMYYFQDEAGRAAVDAGVRINLSRGVMTMPEAESCREIFANWKDKTNGLVKVNMGIHAEYTSSEETVERCVEISRELGMGCHIHMSETLSEHEECKKKRGMTPERYFESKGVFEGPTIAAHGVHIEEEDMDMLAEKKVHIVHCPSSNLKLASGFCPVTRLMKHGVQVALGTDGASSNNTLDMLSDMRLASIVQKALTDDPTALPDKDAIRMATRNGALALGRPECGLLKEGMRADMILLETHSENMIPIPDIPSTVVYAAQSSNIRMTMVDGKIVYRDGTFPTMDAERVLAKAREFAKAIGVPDMQED